MLRRTLVAAGFALAALPVAAQTIDSAYTDVDLDACTEVSADEMGASFACEGYDGIPVSIAEGDLRFFVSYGDTADEEKAASQTLPPFNTLGKKIEWRLADGVPFATILRFFVQREGSETDGQVLVVTKLGEGETCQVAYIDALANKNANELARQAADDFAADFDCEDDPVTVGDFAAW